MVEVARRRRFRPWLAIAVLSVLATLHPQAARSDQAPQAGEPLSSARCSLTWLGLEPDIERFLLEAEVTKLDYIGTGVTRPQRAELEPGGPIGRMAWKPLPPGMRGGFMESYKSEIAAYVLDRLLGLEMVPPAIEREIRGRAGAAIMWIEDAHPWDLNNPPQGPEPKWSRQISAMKLFDQLIANIDRNQGNLMYDDDWHLFLIDHSRAFTTRTSLSGIAELNRVHRATWERIEALTRDELDEALGPWLQPRQINALLTRRDRMRAVIMKMVKARGEAAVFFD